MATSKLRESILPQSPNLRPVLLELAIANLSHLTIGSPKRSKRQQRGWEGFFPYYAGYPESFATDILRSSKLKKDAVVLDPWNGSGTTTYAASQLGLVAKGFDINPVMVVIARARMLPASEADSLAPLAATLVKKSARRKHTLDLDGDPLVQWFSDQSASTIRALERAIRSTTVGGSSDRGQKPDLGRISGLAATLYVALFSACRDLAAPLRSTNPTWIREPRDPSGKITAGDSDILRLFEMKVRDMATTLVAQLPGVVPISTKWNIEVGDTTSISLEANSVDLVLTSPPYCTRIDYTAATRVELSILQPFLERGTGELSRQMIGSVRVPTKTIEPLTTWGSLCLDFLDKVRTHPSKASSTYYYRTHLDYFDKMYRSLSNVAVGLKHLGTAILVVQDSYYKDIHNDLPAIISEMALSQGLSLVRREDTAWNKSISRLNRHNKIYNRTPMPTESVLCFTRTR